MENFRTSPPIKKKMSVDKDVIDSNRNFTNHSETIVQFIIEKLIFFTITEAYRREVESKILTHCWEFLKNMVDNFVKLKFISFDRDDIIATRDNFTLAYKERKPSNPNILNM